MSTCSRIASSSSAFERTVTIAEVSSRGKGAMSSIAMICDSKRSSSSIPKPHRCVDGAMKASAIMCHNCVERRGFGRNRKQT